MKLRVSTRATTGGLAALEKRLKLLKAKKAFVKVGLLGTTTRDEGVLDNPTLGAIHEYGTSTIPARPFLGPTLLEKKDGYLKTLAKQFKKATSPDNFIRGLKLIGLQAVADIRKKITDGLSPPLAQSTIRRKGSSKPLVDSGQLLRAIDYEVIE